MDVGTTTSTIERTTCAESGLSQNEKSRVGRLEGPKESQTVAVSGEMATTTPTTAKTAMPLLGPVEIAKIGEVVASHNVMGESPNRSPARLGLGPGRPVVARNVGLFVIVAVSSKAERTRPVGLEGMDGQDADVEIVEVANVEPIYADALALPVMARRHVNVVHARPV